MRFQEIRNFMQLRLLVWNTRWVDKVLLFDCLIPTNVDRRRRRPKTWVHPKSRDWYTNANKSVPLGKPPKKTQAQRYKSSSPPPFLILLFGTFVAEVVALLLLAYYSSLCIIHAMHSCNASKKASKQESPTPSILVCTISWLMMIWRICFCGKDGSL